MKDTIIKLKCQGSDYIARAGSGKNSKTASSTSSPFAAAHRAAQKFFGEGVRFGFHRLHDGTIHALEGQHMIRIAFEDRGQDFLYWTVNVTTGEVVDCVPFQFGIWTLCKVTNAEALKIGDRVSYRSSLGEEFEISYPLTQVEEI